MLISGGGEVCTGVPHHFLDRSQPVDSPDGGQGSDQFRGDGPGSRGQGWVRRGVRTLLANAAAFSLLAGLLIEVLARSTSCRPIGVRKNATMVPTMENNRKIANM